MQRAKHLKRIARIQSAGLEGLIFPVRIAENKQLLQPLNSFLIASLESAVARRRVAPLSARVHFRGRTACRAVRNASLIKSRPALQKWTAVPVAPLRPPSGGNVGSKRVTGIVHILSTFCG